MKLERNDSRILTLIDTLIAVPIAANLENWHSNNVT